MRVVLDTNVLVSALWSKRSEPARLVALVQNGILIPCYDHRILSEYNDVLRRDKFGFTEWEVTDLLNQLEYDGLSVVPAPLNIRFVDEDDRMFFETAKYCNAKLITGNQKHYPRDPLVVSVSGFLADYLT
jgi:putative PIN family toxin of toxin-antitoxin system